MLTLYAVTVTAVAILVGLAAAGWRRRWQGRCAMYDMSQDALGRMTALYHHTVEQRDALGAMLAAAEGKLATIGGWVTRRQPRRRWLALARRIAREIDA